MTHEEVQEAIKVIMMFIIGISTALLIVFTFLSYIANKDTKKIVEEFKRLTRKT